jgi:phenylacetaldehyde dehydrogenase
MYLAGYRGFLGRSAKMLVNGALVGAVSGKAFEVVNPATGAVIANVPDADKADVDIAVAAARRAFDNGKPYSIVRVADLPLAVDMFRYMGGWATKISGRSIPWSRPCQYLFYTLKEPVGVVGQIIPWNFPLLMAAWKIAPALAAGCTIVLKAAEQTPMTALRPAEIIR